jgi:segregation and condensation protein B
MTETMALGKRIAEAVLFAAEEPLDLATIQAHLPGDLHAGDVVDALKEDYAERGVRLEHHGGRYAFRTSPDIGPYLQRETVQSRRLSKAAMETLAIIAYHQPVTRAEVEDIRGVSTNRGTLDLLLETGWIRPKGRRETPGRPVTWVTTPEFLDHLDLSAIDDLPRIEELMQAGLLGNPGAARAEADDEEASEDRMPEDEERTDDALDGESPDEGDQAFEAAAEEGAEAGAEAEPPPEDETEPADGNPYSSMTEPR